MDKLNKTILKLYFRIIYPSRGATAVEYSIMVALIATVIITAVFTLGNKVVGLFGTVNTNYP